LNRALDALANGDDAGDTRFDDLTIARLINKAHGGSVITAMEVSVLDNSWTDFFTGVMIDLPNKQRRQKIIKQKFEQFEREHPTYGKRFNQ